MGRRAAGGRPAAGGRRAARGGGAAGAGKATGTMLEPGWSDDQLKNEYAVDIAWLGGALSR